MRKFLTVVLLVAALASPVAFTGCGTVATTAYQVESVAIPSVDTAMKIWADWVKAGHATQSQVDQVKSAYNKYYDAQLVVKAALIKYLASKDTASQTDLSTASAAVSAAEVAVIDLVKQFTNTK